MSISLLIVNFNGEEYLETAIASVLSQTRKDFELLIWDDGSSDRSVEIASSYAEDDSRIRVIAAKHRGLAQSRKLAVAQTTGKYIGWVDSDDWIAENTLEEVSQILDNDPAIGMVYTDYYDMNSQGKILGVGKRCQIPYSPERLLVDFMTFQFRLLRREVYEQIGGINPECPYAYDYDLCLRLSEVTQVGRVRKPLYYYRHHGKNMSYQSRQEQIKSSQQAVEQALQRRGLADTYVLQVKGDRFCLRKNEQVTLTYPTPPLPYSPTPLSNLLKKTATLLAALPFTVALGLAPAQAQQIIPNNDGTMTVVTKDGNTFNIDGGSLSKDGKNLFHSFQEFGLDAGQIANFLSNPNIQNILTRINGGNPSIINGLIQVTGGNSNLFLMNPSGIIFGNNASLNVGGDFTATTATNIGLGTGWFNAFGTNDYLNLVGNPNSFDFEGTEAGTIINAGNLEVAEGSNISLTGGTVINTGTIEAPGGNITVAAIPGTNRIRISQAGQILSIELEVPTTESGEQLPVKVTDLPTLLRGLPVDVETGLEVAADDRVTVNGSETMIPNAAGTNVVSGNLNAAGGAINILGEKVGLIDANIDVSGIDGGGTVLIGGDYKGQGIVPNAHLTLVDSDSFINADALETGDGGKVIVWADRTTTFAGNITARGGNESGDGGFVEVSGKENLVFRGEVDVAAPQGDAGSLLLDPDNIIIGDGYNFLDSFPVNNNSEITGNEILTGDSPGATFTISETTLEGLAADADIVLEATNDITIENLFSDGELTLPTNNTGSVTFTADSDSDGVGDFSMSTSDTLKTQGGSITISGANVTTGNIDTRSNIIPIDGENGNPGGAVELTATSGSIVTGDINTSGIDGADGSPYGGNGGDSGNVTITASDTINAQSILASSGAGGNASYDGTSGVSGDITITGNEINFASGAIIEISGIGGSDTTITGNEINFGQASILLTELNSLTLQPLDPNRDIAIAPATTNPNALEITSEELANLASDPVPVQVTIGRDDGEGTITVDSDISNLRLFTLQSPGTNGAIDVNGNINSSSLDLNAGGSVDVSGNITNRLGTDIFGSSITVGDITRTGDSSTNVDIKLEANNGSITTGLIDSIGVGFDNSAGQIIINAPGNITTENIISQGTGDANGGQITLESTSGQITTGSIVSSSEGSGTAGDISLTAPNGIETTFIDGKDINIVSNGIANDTQGLFTATGIDPTGTFSIRGETVSIQHGGGNTDPRTDFIVGDSTTNGTAGNIISGSETVTATTFSNSFTSNNSTIQILTTDAPPEPIIAAEDGTGSIVTAQGDGVTFDIEGGLTSSDSQNLFHSFTRFDLPESTQTANFVANDSLTNILARVSSGNTSEINGTIQVTGGSPNLFLMNPAGIIFGSTAQLDVPAAFTVTTGNGIGFGDQWFSASGNFDETILNGNPDSIGLTMNNPATIENSANLSNNDALNIIGGTVFSQGIISTSQINIVGIDAGTSIVNLADNSVTSTGEVTNLPDDFDSDLIPTDSFSGGVFILGNLDSSGGNITITGTTPSSSEGVLIGGEVSTLNTGNIEILGTSSDYTGIDILASSSIDTGSTNAQITTVDGDITLTGTSNIDLGIATEDTNITSTNGAVAITGNNSDIQLNNTAVNTSNNLTFTADEIDLDSTTTLTGDSVTLQPQEATLDIAVTPNNTTDTRLDITTDELATIQTDTNSVTIGKENSSGRITTTNTVSVNNSLTLQSPEAGGEIESNGTIQTNGNDLTLNANNSVNVNQNLTTAGGKITINSEGTNGTIGTTSATLNATNGGNIDLTATGDIATGDLISESDNTQPAGNITVTSNAGEIDTTSGFIQAGSLSSAGGEVKLTAQNDINTGSIVSGSGADNGGKITLEATQGNIDTTASSSFSLLNNPGIVVDNNNGVIASASLNGNGGAIELKAAGDITTGTVFSSALGGNGSGGNITFTSDNGTIDTTNVTSVSIPLSETEIRQISGLDATNVATDAAIGGEIFLNATSGNIVSEDIATTNNNIDLNGAFTFNQDISLSTDTATGGNIAFNSTVNGNSNLTVESGTGDITFADAVGSSETPLGNLTLNSEGTTQLNDVTANNLTTDAAGTTQLNGNVTTTGDQNYNDGVEITQDTTVEGNDIAFNSTVGSSSSNSLTVNTQELSSTEGVDTGDISFGGEVGSSETPLGNLNLNSGGTTQLNDVTANRVTTDAAGTTQLNGDVTTTADQTYNDGVNLGADVTLEGTNVRANSTVNGEQSLTVNASGNTTFNAQVGTTNALSSLTTNAAGITQLNGDVTTTADQTYNDAVEIGQDTTVEGNDISFNSTVGSSSSNSLTVNTQELSSSEGIDPGDITFGDEVGGNEQALSNLTINSDRGTTNLNGNVTTTESQTYNTDVNLNNSEGTTQITADADNNGSGIVSTQNITSAGQSLEIQGNSITTGNIDTSDVSFGIGNVTLTSANNIETGYIDSSGEIKIDTNGDTGEGEGLFTATATIPETNISLRGGTVTIEHGGGNTNPRTNFNVGVADTDTTTNGTVGNITTTSDTPETIAPFPQSFEESFTSLNSGSIKILTTDLPTQFPIIAADDSVGSVVTPQEDGVTFNIEGGSISSDNNNLFHSFKKFDLPESTQTANFVANDSLTNILARVSSGDASEINGKIQVTGGNPNLFLINPAGVIFGSSASLDVPGDFTATTGNGIGFSDNWFSATGDNFTPLDGNPDSIALTMNNPGAIINNANLTNSNGVLNLVGGTIYSQGAISASGIKAFGINEGERIVSLSDNSVTNTNGVDNLPEPFNFKIFSMVELASQLEENVNVSNTEDELGIIVKNSINSNSADLILTGTATDLDGINVNSPNALDSSGGNIFFTGSSLGDEPIEIFESQVNSGGGNITLDAIGANGVAILSSSINSDTGDITLTGDEISLTRDITDTTVAETAITGNNITLQPQNPELDIAVAPNNTTDTRLDITTEELATIQSETNSVTIGREDSTGRITITNPVNVNNSLTLQSPEAGGEIETNGEIITNGNDLTLNAADSVKVNQNITAGNGNININSAGTTQLNNVTANSLTTDSSGTTQLNGDVTTTGDQTYNDAVNLSGNVTLEGTNVTANSTVDGEQSLTVNTSGNTTFAQAVGSTNALSSLTTDTGGTTQVNDAVTTTGEQNFGDKLITTGNLTLTSDTNITLNEVDFDGVENSTLTSAAGENINLEGEIADSNPGNDVLNIDLTSNNNGGTIATGGAINTGGGDISITNTSIDDVAIDIKQPLDSNGGDITLNGTSTNQPGILIDNSVNADGSVNSAGGEIQITGTSVSQNGVLIRGEVQNDNSGNLEITGTSTNGVGIKTEGVANTDGSVTYSQITTAEGTINLTGKSDNNLGVDTQITNITSTNGEIVITGDNSNIQLNFITAVNTNNNITFTADEIDLDTTNTTIKGNNVTLQPENPELDIAITPNNPEAENRLDLTTEELATIQPDTNSLAIGREDSSGNISNTNPVSFNNPVTLRTSGNIQVNSTITGEDDASITLNAAQTNLNADISTAGNELTINSDIALGNNVTLNTTEGEATGADINLNDTVDGNQSLTINGGERNIAIAGAVGSNQPLENLTIKGNGTTQLNSGSVNTTGNQIYNQDLVVTNVEFTDDGNITETNGNIKFTAGGNIIANDIFVSKIQDSESNLEIKATSITTNNISISGEEDVAGGNINLTSTAGAIETENINTSGTRGGNITLNSASTISTGDIDSSGNPGDGGNVTLNSQGNIQVSTIKAEGGEEGRGGNVRVNENNEKPPLFAAIGTLDEAEAVSISTKGGLGGGEIVIRHGGNGEAAFVVGDRTLSDIENPNGTAGTIRSKDVFINSDSFLFTEKRGDIGIISVLPVPPTIVEPPKEIEPPPETPEPVNSTNNTVAIATIPEARQTLMKVARQAAQKPALVYVDFTSSEISASENTDSYFANAESCRTAEYEASLGLETNKAQPTLCIAPQPSDRLEIMLITSEDEPILVNVDVTRQEVEKMAERLYREVSRPGGKYYKGPGKKLYEWLIGSIEEELQKREIDNLLFIMPPKLRSLPIAALYDGENEEYLVQKNYNIGFAPSLNLMDTSYKNIQNSPVLAFGASDFEADEKQQPLPAVEIELPTINQIRGGKSILNQDFTLENLRDNLKENRAPIIHLSTHADFNPQDTDDIYIQLYNRKLTLDQLRELDLSHPTVELLVISACRSAFGDTKSELGFGGLAVKAGVKTAIGSLWYVGDTSTSALMSEFYHQLNIVPVKAKALREAQIAMIEGKVKTQDNAIATTWGEIPLPENLVNQNGYAPDWSHPYYWAPFTIIGSPW